MFSSIITFIEEITSSPTTVIDLVSSIATVGALFAAIRNNKQTQTQFEYEKKRQYTQELRNQAEKITVWFEDNDIHKTIDHKFNVHAVPRGILIQNNSSLPIYNVIITEVGQIGAGPNPYGELQRIPENDYFSRRILFNILPPGLWGQIIDTDGNGMHVVTALEISFTDAKGNNWIRRGNGSLERVMQDTYMLYHIPLPAIYSAPVRAE